MTALKAPFPYFGGKSGAAEKVWSALGDVDNYVEPFAGSGAVLLARPHRPRVETINDADGYVANAWRAMQLRPDETAQHADWPVIEADLHARHRWLLGERERVTEALIADPEWCDPRAAGWWIWGACCWIGGGWCSGTRSPQLPYLSGDGRGVHKPSMKLPRLSDDGSGVHRPDWAASGYERTSLAAWFAALSARLRGVRVCCGDWARVCTPAVTTWHLQCFAGGTCGVFLDPPYGDTRSAKLYAKDDITVAAACLRWCIERGAAPNIRIVLAGYEGEHEALAAHGWRAVEWFKAGFLRGGYAQQGADGHQQHRERLWLSPQCLADRQGELFA